MSGEIQGVDQKSMICQHLSAAIKIQTHLGFILNIQKWFARLLCVIPVAYDNLGLLLKTVITQTFGMKTAQPVPDKENYYQIEPKTSQTRLKKKLSDLMCQKSVSRLYTNDSLDNTTPLRQFINISLKTREGDETKSLESVRFASKFVVGLKKLPACVIIRPTRLEIDSGKGGAILINKDKKSVISKTLAYICKPVLTTGSFMGISFPTFSMKPESILQTYCKCLGAVPVIMWNPYRQPADRVKSITAIAMSLSIQFNDIEKALQPHNTIGGHKFYAEQVSHHPPVSAFILQDHGYSLHARIQVHATLGFNSAVGNMKDELTLQFADGGVVRAGLPKGIMSGMMFGETRLAPTGACFSYDFHKRLVCSAAIQENDEFVGSIGQLHPAAGDGDHAKFQRFNHIPEKDFQLIQSRVRAKWSEGVWYDNQSYLVYANKNTFPFKPTQNSSLSKQERLLSDSSQREDIKLWGLSRIEESQACKQRIEEEERYFRKLRQAHKNKRSDNQ